MTDITYIDIVGKPAEELQRMLSEASPEEAARWVKAAAINGGVAAMVHWGQMLLSGHGIAPDPAAALRWFRIAADAGSIDGLNMVGRCHELGWGTGIDMAKAARWYGLAGEKGDGWGCFNLGCLMLRGDGIDRDARKALPLFVRSARAGNAKAINMLGRYREEGWTHRPDPVAARRWYARAASRGCFRGCFHLGRLLLDEGEADKAVQWLERSLTDAPDDFRAEALVFLTRHPHPAARALALLPDRFRASL